MAEAEPLFHDCESAPSISGGEAICLFAFAEFAKAPLPPPQHEAFERQIILYRVGSVAALIGVVQIADYCGIEAERRLADIAWLAPRVRRHAELTAWAMRWSPIFPVPFGTLYSSLASLTTFIHAHDAKIADFLHTVTDKEEWELRGVARLDRPGALDDLACRLWPGWQELSRGARYMRLCRDRDRLIDFGRSEAALFMHDCVAELQPLTAGVRDNAIRRADPPGDEPLGRHALLLAKADVAAVRKRVEDIALRALRQNILINLSGPWPPFSFRPDLDAA
jgi:hypothetical protein